jgi:hypothetical protein
MGGGAPAVAAKVLRPRIEKIFLTPPTWGMRAGHFAATIRARWVEQPVAFNFDTRSGLPETPVGIAPSGFEVLVNYALNSIELTNQFLRFPRVRQQTRGNFSFQYL